MLASLKIKNVALIEELEIDFDNNLNVITGETGSGKSIMLNALSFVVGDRLDKTQLREGTDLMRVDAFFTNLSANVCNIIKNQFDIEIEDNELLISREYNINGKTFCKANGNTITTAILKKISSYLIDVHGQHEHQSLLNNDYQLEILDKFCKEDISDKLTMLNSLIDELNEINKKIKLFGGDEKAKQNLIDLYKYQIEEMEQANISDGEFEEKTLRLKEMKDSEKISQVLNENLQILDKNAYSLSCIEQLVQAKKNLQNLTGFSNKYSEISERLDIMAIELEDVIGEIHSSLDNLNFTESEFDALDERVDTIKKLFNKYGGDYKKYIDYYNNTKEKFSALINGEEEYQKLSNDKICLEGKIFKLQDEISLIRIKNANIMTEQIAQEIRLLGMKNAKISLKFDKTQEPYTRHGQDVVEFMFSANTGFEQKPLNKIASGGELSRFMLAYKIVVGKIDEIETLVFDEIDTGISGNTANMVAECMGKLAKQKQLIVVTHLPQICAMGDKNFLVEKLSNTKTCSVMTEIYEENLYKEIARLMGFSGQEGLEIAKKLKNNASDFKSSVN